MGYRPALDGLRAFAVLAVLAFHVTNRHLWHYKGGFLGVDVFFVISGCLITLLLLAEHERSTRISLPAFYARRALRLLPALVLTIVWVGLFIQLTGWRAGQPYRKSALEALFYVANWASIGSAGSLSYLTHTWSLSIEEQFYLIWPFVLLILLRRRVSRAHLLRGVLAVIALVVVGRAIGWLVVGVEHYRFFYLSTVTRADCILIGVALGIALSDPRLTERLRWTQRVPVAIAAAAGLFAITLFTRVVSGWYYLGGATLVALLAAVLVAHGAGRDSGPVARTLEWGPLVHVGRRSYGLYLVHLPLIAILDRTNNEHWQLGSATFVLVAVVACLVAMEVSWYAVERPALRLKDRRWERPRARVTTVEEDPRVPTPTGVVAPGEAAP